MLRCQIFTVLCVCLCMVLALKPAQADDLATLREGSLKFAASLYKALSEKEGNLLISPLSIHSVLTMLSFGARADTAKQMTNTLGLKSNDETSREYKKLRELLQPEKSLRLANKIYPAGGKANVASNFLKQTKDVFASEAQVLDYTKSKNAADTINKWVEDKTDHKIKDLISPDSLSKDTAIVLVSAVYFKGMWGKQFVKGEDKDFHMKHQTVKVPTMNSIADYHYKKDKTARILELPYQAYEISMFVILPEKSSDLKAVEADILSGGLNINHKDLTSTYVSVTLPKFRIEYSTELNDVLKELGMEIIFEDGKADFGGMIADVKTKVDKVIHKTLIEVNESGIDAVAATGDLVKKTLSARRIPPKEFIVDQPFIFLLKQKETGQVLFLGRCEDPRK